MTGRLDRPAPREAGPELLILARFEDWTTWFCGQTARWPKRVRATLTARLENHAFDIVEELVQARYRRDGRAARLARVDLALERMRHLLRLACALDACPAKAFEQAIRGLDEVGRMLHGWRTTTGAGER